MTPDESPDTTDTTAQSRLDPALHIVTTGNLPDKLEAQLTDLVETDTPVPITVAEQDTPDVEWDRNSPCPNCGCTEIQICRAIEESWTYNETTGELEYNGHSTATAVLAGQQIRAFCPNCDATLMTHATDTLTDWQTL